MHRYTSKVPSKDTNSRFQANKTLAVRSHFKIGFHFCGNPVYYCSVVASVTPGLHNFFNIYILHAGTYILIEPDQGQNTGKTRWLPSF